MSDDETVRKVGLRPVVQGEMNADAAWLRASVEAFEPRLQELEARQRRATGPGAWSGPRPDLGCGLTCRCCPRLPARPVYDLDHAAPAGTERADALDRAVADAHARGRTLVLGATADPWAGDAARRARTRALLEACRPLRDGELVISTASPLVLCDTDLLTALDRTSSLTVEMVLPTADAELMARMDPGGSTPTERLGALAEIAAEGIATHLRVAPLLPGLTDSAAALRPLLATTAGLGVVDVTASPLRLPWRRRRRFFTWLKREDPELLPRYRRLYPLWRRTLSASERERLLTDFHRLRLELGFPRAVPGRG